MNLEVRPFRVKRFMYTPPPAAKRAKEIDAVGSGVLLYRDGVMVEPYGLDGNDWIGVSARKAQRQGYALIQPSVFSGFVLISRLDNPALRDQSNRQGLLESEISEAFCMARSGGILRLERVRCPGALAVGNLNRIEGLNKRRSRGDRSGRDPDARDRSSLLGQPLQGWMRTFMVFGLSPNIQTAPAHVSRESIRTGRQRRRPPARRRKLHFPIPRDVPAAGAYIAPWSYLDQSGRGGELPARAELGCPTSCRSECPIVSC